MDFVSVKSKPQSGGFISYALSTLLSCLLIFVINKLGFPDYPISIKPPRIKPQEITWELLPVKINKSKFAIASKSVPINKPDDTDLVSDRDQQAAQPTPPKNQVSSSTPHSTLEVKALNHSAIRVESNNITEKKTISSPMHYKEKSQKNINITVKNETQNEGFSFQSIESTSKVLDIRKPIKNKIHDSRLLTNGSKGSKMRPRPRVTSQLLNKPSLKSLSNAPRLGNLAIDSRLHPFGVYLQRMMKSIQGQWYQLLDSSYPYIRSMSTPQTFVYQFKLKANGTIEELRLSDHPHQDSLAAEICRQAIASRSPFGQWTPEMIQEFGDYDAITIRFEFL